MALRFDRATFADLESLLLLMKKMQVADPWSEPFEESIVRFSLAQLLQNPAYGMACLVSDDGRPIAYLLICFDYSLEYRGKGAWIDELFVEVAHRGQGIGTRLLELAETSPASLAPSSFTSRSATTTLRSNSTAAADTSTTSVT